jgi:hypothetical protein
MDIDQIFAAHGFGGANAGKVPITGADRFNRITNSQARDVATKESKKKKVNPLVTMIPSALAAGASFIPGVGTVAAAGLGGIGELLRQRMSGEEMDLKKAAGEAALSAIPGGLGKVGKLAKAAKGISVTRTGLQTAKAAGEGAKVAGVADDAVSAGSKGLLGKLKTGLATQGQQMEARSGGFGVGAKVSGSAPLDYSSSAQISKTLAEHGIKAGNPISRLRGVEDKLAEHGAQIDDFIKTNNRVLTAAERKAIAGEYMDAVKGTANVNEAVLKNAKQLSDNFIKQGKDVKGMIDFRRGLDRDAISYIANPDAALAANQQAAKVMRGVLAGKTSELIPDMKGANTAYSKLAGAKEYLVQGGGQVNKPSGGLIGRIIDSGPVQAAESRTGRVLQRLGGEAAPVAKGASKAAGAIGGVAGTAGRYVKALAAQGAVRIPGAVMGAQPDPNDPNAADPNDPNAMLPGDEADMASVEGADGMDSSGNVFTPELLQMMAIQDIQATGGKNLNQIATLQKLFGGGAGGKKPMSAEASKLTANVSSGMRALDEIEAQLGQDSNLPAKNAAGGLLGNFGRGMAGTQSFEAANNEIVDVLTRMRTGAAISANEEKIYKAQLPQPFDSPDVIQEKLNRYRQLFTQIGGNASGGSPDIESLMGG